MVTALNELGDIEHGHRVRHRRFRQQAGQQVRAAHPREKPAARAASQERTGAGADLPERDRAGRRDAVELTAERPNANHGDRHVRLGQRLRCLSCRRAIALISVSRLCASCRGRICLRVRSLDGARRSRDSPRPQLPPHTAATGRRETAAGASRAAPATAPKSYRARQRERRDRLGAARTAWSSSSSASRRRSSPCAA